MSFSASAASTLRPGIPPQDRRAPLRRDHAVDGELVHENAIADRESQRPAAPAFAVDDDDDRRVERRHLAQVERDGLGDPALFRLDARIRRRRVDEGNHRAAEFLGQLHRAQRLPVALGLGVAEVSIDLLLRVAAALVMAHDQHRFVAVVGEPGDDGVIVGEAPVAADLGEVGEQTGDVVQHRRPVRVARHQDPLPGREVLVDLPAERVDPHVQTVERSLAVGGHRQHRQRLDLLQQQRDRFLEVECVRWHGQPRSTQAHRTGAADLFHVGHQPL